MATNAKKPFSSIVSLEQFCQIKGIKKSNLGIAKTKNGSIMMIASGSPVATIKKELQGATAAETVLNLSAINLCFGIPNEGNVDTEGRPSLPCALESVSQWEEVSLGF